MLFGCNNYHLHNFLVFWYDRLRQVYIMDLALFITKRVQNLLNSLHHFKEDEAEQIAYGLSMLLLIAIETSLVVFLFWVLGCLKQGIIVLSAFGFLRIFAGGLHLPKSNWCFIVTFLAYLMIILLGIHLPYTNLLFYGGFALSAILLLLYAPADTKAKPLGQKRKRKLKYCTFGALFILFFIASLQTPSIAMLITWSCLVESLTTTPFFYSLAGCERGCQSEKDLA